MSGIFKSQFTPPFTNPPLKVYEVPKVSGGLFDGACAQGFIPPGHEFALPPNDPILKRRDAEVK